MFHLEDDESKLGKLQRNAGRFYKVDHKESHRWMICTEGATRLRRGAVVSINTSHFPRIHDAATLFDDKIENMTPFEVAHHLLEK